MTTTVTTEKTFTVRTEVETYPVAGGTRVVVTTVVNGLQTRDVAEVCKRDRNFWVASEGHDAVKDYRATAKTKAACITRYVNDRQIKALRFAAYESTD